VVMPFAITVCPRTLTSPEGREFGGKILALGPFFVCLGWGHTNHNVSLPMRWRWANQHCLIRRA
jgi:hypothetical protein